MSHIGRNTLCPCGSGLKYKRCCSRSEDAGARDALVAERVWDRMQTWALTLFGDDFQEPLSEHMEARGVGSEKRPADDEDLSLAVCWLLIDRELDDGGTPAGRYAELPDLTLGERGVAQRIAASRLGLFRVRDVHRGAWLELESLLDGAVTRVSSPNVSREAVPWHVLMCRVMEGVPLPSLWGAAGFYEPAEEPELLAELRRIAAAHGLGVGQAGLEQALRAGAGELVCFMPASRRAEPVPYTLEGDLVAMTEATWRVREPRVALAVLLETPELAYDGETEDGTGATFYFVAERRELIARRGALPPGAIVMEGGPVAVGDDGELELEDVTSLGTFTLREDRLEFFGISEARLAAAVALVKRRLGSRAGRPTRRVRTVEEAVGAARSGDGGRPAGTVHRGASPPHVEPRMRDLAYRRWLDDPDHRLGGLTPRQAAGRAEYRDELERALRSFEHHSARERDDARPGPEVAWLRAELGLGEDRLVA